MRPKVGGLGEGVIWKKIYNVYNHINYRKETRPKARGVRTTKENKITIGVVGLTQFIYVVFP
jgi:hypothetical protein